MGHRGSRVETDFGKGWDEVRIADLREWHEIFGICRLCARRHALPPRYTLVRRFGQDALLVDLQTRLKCTGCKNAVANQIEVERLPRD